MKQSLLQLQIPWTTFVSEIPNIINDENVNITPGQGEKPVLILSNEFCEKQIYLLPKGKFGYNASWDIPISCQRSRYSNNQRLLNFNQCFASDADYIFFARSVYE